MVFKVSGKLEDNFEASHEVHERALTDRHTFISNYSGGSEALMEMLLLLSESSSDL